VLRLARARYVEDPSSSGARYKLMSALINRMLNTIASEREQVVAMLCGPDPIVTTWKPAAETCADEPNNSP